MEYICEVEEGYITSLRAAFLCGLLAGNPGVLLLGKVSPMLDVLEAQRRRGDN
jgi:hypothetical protein